MIDRKRVEALREKYPAGTRIELISMYGEADMEQGLTGSVDFVDDIGQLQMTWDNGRTLALDARKDSFKTIPAPEQEQSTGGMTML